jgi:hypothetical protein
MAIQESDIKFYYSQPPTGTEYSFGGTYSNEITGKNLFSNISQTTLANGIIDYRCIYLKNNNETESFNDFKISITEYLPSYIEFGFDGVYSLNSSADIINVVAADDRVTYTTSANHGFSSGQSVLVIGIKGADLSGYNINTEIDSVTPNTFTVISTATGTYINDADNGGGIASQTLIKFVDEEQTLIINYSLKPTTEGSGSYFWLQYENKTIQVFWKNDIDEQVTELQIKLRDLDIKLNQLLVDYYEDTDEYRSFKITIPNQRANDTITIAKSVSDNPLNLSTNTEVVKYGGPSTGVTRVDSAALIRPAVEFSNSQTAPSVNFFDVTKSVTLNYFYPGDYLAMWIKRTVIAGSTPEDGDGFSINIDAKGSTVDVTRSPLCPTCPPAETPLTPGPTATPTLTPGPTATLGPTLTPGPTATPTLTPGPTETIGPTATPTLTPGPTATLGSYSEGDIVTLSCSFDDGITIYEDARSTLSIFDTAPVYCKELKIKFRYKETVGNPKRMDIYITQGAAGGVPAWGNNEEILIGVLTMPDDYVEENLLIEVKLCDNEWRRLTDQGVNIDDPALQFPTGDIILYEVFTDSIPRKNQCDPPIP